MQGTLLSYICMYARCTERERERERERETEQSLLRILNHKILDAPSLRITHTYIHTTVLDAPSLHITHIHTYIHTTVLDAPSLMMS